jgi:hypothetical protein
VREKQTVPLGSNTADELAIPSGVVISFVEIAQVPSSSRISPSVIQGTSPPQYA